MILISHRGNINGPNSAKENDPEYILEALENYHVEIDVWFIDGQFMLGHNEPQYNIREEFLENEKLWCHAKNPEALEAMLQNTKIHCFWHQNDDMILTSKNYIWTYPGKILTPHSIAVLPELVMNWDISNVVGVCSDYIENAKQNSQSLSPTSSPTT